MYILRYILPFLTCVFLTRCVCSQLLYTEGKKIIKKDLTEESYSQLRKLLQKNSLVQLQDTIMLKYDFKNETCWNLLDSKPKEYINRVLKGSQKRIDSIRQLRKGVSIFEYREKAKNLNKIKKWNASIIIDSSSQIYKILFDKKSICGNSAIILPDRRVIIFLSDSHFTALYCDREKILNILSAP